mmetsp:Transcript_22991/g.40424  ORF Transcript_22991/g.40424 Transcript_22991/m.40424 type:complete len:246 (-) Transcript_22991:1115-1852(-)
MPGMSFAVSTAVITPATCQTPPGVQRAHKSHLNPYAEVQPRGAVIKGMGRIERREEDDRQIRLSVCVCRWKHMQRPYFCVCMRASLLHLPSILLAIIYLPVIRLHALPLRLSDYKMVEHRLPLNQLHHCSTGALHVSFLERHEMDLVITLDDIFGRLFSNHVFGCPCFHDHELMFAGTPSESRSNYMTIGTHVTAEMSFQANHVAIVNESITTLLNDKLLPSARVQPTSLHLAILHVYVPSIRAP